MHPPRRPFAHMKGNFLYSEERGGDGRDDSLCGIGTATVAFDPANGGAPSDRSPTIVERRIQPALYSSFHKVALRETGSD